MHRHLMFAATLCLSAGSAFAAFPTLDVANATVDLAVSQAELDAANGPAGISIRGMGILPSGNLIIWDNDNAAGAGLLEIDVSGVSPVITTLVDHADVVAVTTDPSVSPNAIRATSDGTVFISEFTTTDSIVRIANPGQVGQTVTAIYTGDGIVSIDPSSPEGTLVTPLESAFGGPSSEDLLAVPDAGGSPSTIIDAAGLIAALPTYTNAPWGMTRTDPTTGDYITFAEQGFGGGDQLLRITPAGAVSVIMNPADFPNGAPAIEALAVDSRGDIFMFDNDTLGGSASLIIRQANGTISSIPNTTIAATAGQTILEAEDVAIRETATDVHIYVSDDDFQNIYLISIPKLEPPPVTASEQYEMYR